jgi:hypothetical protein
MQFNAKLIMSKKGVVIVIGSNPFCYDGMK